MSTAARVTEQKPETGSYNPFAREMSQHANAGAVEIESSRAIAEAQGKLVIAKKFPRDQYTAMQRILDACSRPSLADSSMYEYSRGGSKVRGPSIRLAEEIARCWGNIEYGQRELSNRGGVSEMEAYAWDLETNTYSSQRFTVRHVRDTKGGSYDLTDQRDVYEMTANLGARRMRARILAIIPDDVVEAAIKQCVQTISHGGGEPFGERIQRLVSAFGQIGVSVGHLEKRLGHPMAETLPEELVELRSIYQSLKDGQSTRTDWFGSSAERGAPIADSGRTERQPYSPESYAANLKAWQGLIETGRKTADDIIKMVESKGDLSAEQKAEIRAFEVVQTEAVEGELLDSGGAE